MGLTNSQYNSILRDYDTKQYNSRHLLDMRTKEVEATIPEFKKLNEEMVSNSISCAKKALFNPSAAEKDLEDLKSNNIDVAMEKIELLLEHGYPADYLTPVYECEKCKDTGYVNGEKCSCFKQAIIRLLYSQTLINTAIDKENFDTFSFEYYSDKEVDPAVQMTPYENIHNVVAKCKTFIDEFDKEYSKREHKNLLIYGNTGVGKTFLANCVAREILNSSHSVVYITATELFETLSKYSFDKGEDFELESQVDYINNCDLLIIDDLGTELSNTFTNSQLYSCINNRMLKNLSVIISTNYKIKELQATYSERIFSRFVGEYTMLRIVGDDIRTKIDKYV